MGLFYVYFRHTGTGYLVAFTNRETADEWWRIISTSPTYSGTVERSSPQLYVQGPGPACAAIYSSDPVPLTQFSKKMFITQLDQNYVRVPITLPPVTITDHISGGWYFIRSKADPFSHWYLRTNSECLVCGDEGCDAIHVSSEYRTRFCVRVRNTADGFQVPETFVMIGRDEVSITAPKGYALHVSDTGDLKATSEYQGDVDLLFGDLKKRFITRAEKQVNGEVWEYVEAVERSVGEPWELVD